MEDLYSQKTKEIKFSLPSQLSLLSKVLYFTSRPTRPRKNYTLCQN